MTERKLSLVGTDGDVESYIFPHANTRFGRRMAGSPKITVEGGEKFVHLSGGKYHVTGPWYTYDYKLKRTLYIGTHKGLQKLWIEGQVEPFYFEPTMREDARRNTAKAMHDAIELDAIEKVMNPAPINWLMFILIAGLAAMIGFALGQSL